MNKMKETALTVAGLASVLVAGQTVANAATTYSVKSGDTLSELANKFNLTVEDLVKSNNIKDANMIFVDQQLAVPTETVAVSSAATSTNAASSAAASTAATVAASLAASSSAASSAAASQAAASSAAASSAAASQAAASSAAASSAAASSVAASQAAASSAASSSVAASQATTSQVTSQQSTAPKQTATPVSSGSVHDRFIQAGGTEGLWRNIVLPESGGNPNAVSSNGYHGLGQTKQGWGYGSVEVQTQGLVNYAVSRYGSIDNAVQFRVSNGWW